MTVMITDDGVIHAFDGMAGRHCVAYCDERARRDECSVMATKPTDGWYKFGPDYTSADLTCPECVTEWVAIELGSGGAWEGHAER